jgi:hypothetical protein
MSKAQITLNIAHDNPKGIHQESFQWEFEIREDGNWIQSFMDYVNDKENKDEPPKPEIIK